MKMLEGYKMNQQEIAEANAKALLQDMSYRICDHCKVDPLKCGYRYGNRFRCAILADEIDKIFDESAAMHGG